MKNISLENYIQKRNILSNLDDYLNDYHKVLFYVDAYILKTYASLFEQYALKYTVTSSLNEVQGDCIVGIGGGRIMDEAKYFAYQNKIDCILVPTSAATDAPCTNICVVNGKYVPCGFPKMVLVDEDVITQAPPRFLVSGIADALSTYFESKDYDLSLSMSCLSKTCLETILTFGKQAIADQKAGLVTNALSNCIEAIIYMSGLVYANSGGSLTHALANSFNKYVPTVMHGELVAYFLLVQLCIENDQRIHELREFYKAVGLPTHLKDIGMEEVEEEDLEFMLSECDSKLISKMKNIIKNDEIIEAIFVVDAFE